MIQLARRYKMSDALLMEVCMRLQVGATRDSGELSNFGWTAARLGDLGTARDAFSDLPTDPELSGMMAEATAAKNLARKNATEFCAKEIMLRVSLHYGEGSPTYKRFKSSELYATSDHGLWLVFKRIHRQATLLAAALADEGLTAAHLATLAALIAAMSAALLAQDEAIDNRDRAVHERIEAGNALYDEMVKLGEVGKRLWLNVDESKYNEYVLYAHRGGKEPEANEQVFESDVTANSVLNLSVTSLDGSESISASNTGTSDLYVYFAALPTDLPVIDSNTSSGASKLQPGEQNTRTVAELGFETDVREYLNVYNPNADTVGSIALTVSG